MSVCLKDHKAKVYTMMELVTFYQEVTFEGFKSVHKNPHYHRQSLSILTFLFKL